MLSGAPGSPPAAAGISVLDGVLLFVSSATASAGATRGLATRTAFGSSQHLRVGRHVIVNVRREAVRYALAGVAESI